jgi:hypothetical protein
MPIKQQLSHIRRQLLPYSYHAIGSQTLTEGKAKQFIQTRLTHRYAGSCGLAIMIASK